MTIDSQLVTRQYPVPLSDDLMSINSQWLISLIGTTKSCWAQKVSSPEDHCFNVNCFLASALPLGYFQEVMDKLTADLQGVNLYLDDIVIRGFTVLSIVQSLLALFS